MALSHLDYGEKLVDKFFEKGEMLSDFPEMSRQVPEFQSPFIRELLYQNFRIIYKYEKDLIQILTIHNGLTPLSDKSIFD
ncbi:MAG: type II toxin-antitoxin system RelE/ParE family toxin [Marinoscillum sp.]